MSVLQATPPDARHHEYVLSHRYTHPPDDARQRPQDAKDIHGLYIKLSSEEIPTKSPPCPRKRMICGDSVLFSVYSAKKIH